MVKRNIQQYANILRQIHPAAKQLLCLGILLSIGMLCLCICLALVNLHFLLDPFLTKTGMLLAEGAVSMFTLSVGCGLVFDYAIKKQQG